MRLFVAMVLLAATPLAAQIDPSAILTPKPGPQPKINGPRVYGARPGKPFVYRIPCTGDRPVKFTAKGLPSSMKLDPATGIITGTTPKSKGTFKVTFAARNARGSATREFRLVVGDKLALTPPMGWNDWYTHYHNITDKTTREAADIMIASGMADFGYQYVNLDDCWMRKPNSPDPKLGGAQRDASGEILTSGDFPDMKALTDYIHSKGLRAGIYTSPGPLTCAGYTAAWEHEAQDARTFARWGFDFLKYDLCSYRKVAPLKTVDDDKKPYIQMGKILEGLDRDVVYNLCQYGRADVWKWGGEVGGHAWRTTGDLGLEKDTNLPGFYSIAFKNAEHFENAKPGEWNDPDYILIGYVGNARQQNAPPRYLPLTADEQYSYMSLWSLMASPLFYSGHMGKLDAFTLNVLCNSDVIDINQDELGKQARIIRKTADEYILARPLVDGSLAVGLFNISGADREIEVSWKDLGISGTRTVHDVWRQKDVGPASNTLKSKVARHGVSFVRLDLKAAKKK